MKLQDSLPDGVQVGRRFYRLDFDFRNVLKMMEILGRDDLIPEAREYLALKCLTKHPRNVPAVLQKVRETLFQTPPKKSGKKVTSFEQDAGLIRSAFRQSYGIDLFTDKLHWLEFVELLNNIPEGNRYAEVVGLRARPVPAPTKYNKEEREWLLKAKADVAIRLTEAEAAKKYDEDVKAAFAGIMNFFGLGGENSNGE